MAPPSQGALSGPNSGVHSLNNHGALPILLGDSQGVLGLKNLEMSKDSTLTSPGKEVKLDSGSQMMILATMSTPVE